MLAWTCADASSIPKLSVKASCEYTTIGSNSSVSTVKSAYQLRSRDWLKIVGFSRTWRQHIWFIVCIHTQDPWFNRHVAQMTECLVWDVCMGYSMKDSPPCCALRCIQLRYTDLANRFYAKPFSRSSPIPVFYSQERLMQKRNRPVRTHSWVSSTATCENICV